MRMSGVAKNNGLVLSLHSSLCSLFCRYENVQEKENLPASALLPMQSNDYLSTLATKEEKMVMISLDQR